MSINTNRLIGLTQERAMEINTGVTDLHIGWQNEYSQQEQRDPAGHLHRAPVVTWKKDDVTYQFVPRLTFRVNVTETPWIRRVLGLTDDPAYIVDGAELATAIEKQLLSRGKNPLNRSEAAEA